MGDMADFINDDSVDDSGWEENEEEFIGPGKCPVCNGPTHLITKGKYGPFYGCDGYPECTGTRNVEEN